MTSSTSFAFQRSEPRKWASAFVASLPLLWDGLPFAVASLPTFYGFYVVSALILIGIGLFGAEWLIGKCTIDGWMRASIGLFIYCILVTVISSLFFFENPILEWVPALSNYSPMLLIVLLKYLDIQPNEILEGVVWAAAAAGILVFIDHFIFPLYFIGDFSRASGLDISDRRVVLLKNEQAIAILILFARIFDAKKILAFAVNAALFLLLGWELVSVSQTRLVIGAVLLAMTCYVLFTLRGVRRLVALGIGALGALALLPFIFSKYISQITSTSDFLAQDRSIIWRLLTVEHYRKYFDQTYGIGFGIMSSGEGKDSIISFSAHKGSLLYGDTPDFFGRHWGLFLADISFYSVLFQFGYIGLIVVILMSLKASWTMIKTGRQTSTSYSTQVNAVGFVMFFLIINPWPLNFFTLIWSLLGGNLLWYLASRVDLPPDKRFFRRFKRYASSVGFKPRRLSVV